jgi:hypothetical protein
MRKSLVFVACGALTVVALGCARDASPPASAASDASSAVDGSKYLLAAAPDAAQEVVQARESAKDDQDVVVIGRIGGSKDPWIAGRAAFSIVDRSLKPCSDTPGDTCPKPWDYCCQTDKLPTATALVKIVDDRGQLVKAEARELLGVKELSTVVVKGKARRDDAGNLTVLAVGVYVEKEE